MSLQHRLEQALEFRGIKPKTLSLKAGLNETAIRDILKGRSQNPRTDTVRKIADTLEIRPEWLLNGFGLMSEEASPTGTLQEPSFTQAPTSKSGKIPVYSTSSFDAVWPYQFDFENPVDYVASLPALETVSKAHAVYVADNKMAPRYFVGETLYIHPARPVQNGEDCLLVHKSNKGLIGKLDAQDSNGVHLSFYNEEGRVFVLSSEIKALCPIVASLKN